MDRSGGWRGAWRPLAGDRSMGLAGKLPSNEISKRLTLVMGLFYAYSARIIQQFLEV